MHRLDVSVLLALSGMILLPVVKMNSRYNGEKAASDNRRELMNAARNGDQTAIETLTLDDMDIYSKMSKRLKNEDVFTIVDTYFMPYGPNVIFIPLWVRYLLSESV